MTKFFCINAQTELFSEHATVEMAIAKALKSAISGGLKKLSIIGLTPSCVQIRKRNAVIYTITDTLPKKNGGPSLKKKVFTFSGRPNETGWFSAISGKFDGLDIPAYNRFVCDNIESSDKLNGAFVIYGDRVGSPIAIKRLPKLDALRKPYITKYRDQPFLDMCLNWCKENGEGQSWQLRTGLDVPPTAHLMLVGVYMGKEAPQSVAYAAKSLISAYATCKRNPGLVAKSELVWPEETS